MNKRLIDYFKHHNTIDIPTANAIGISRAMLSYLVKNGELQRIAQGQYNVSVSQRDDSSVKYQLIVAGDL